LAWLLLSPVLSHAGQLQWRASRAATPDAAVQPVADEAPRSVVVSRAGVKAPQNGQFDPFEEDAAGIDAPMPEAAPPAPTAPFDPFDEPAVDEPASGGDVAEPSPSTVPPAAALDEMVAPEGATDREALGEAAAEIAAPAAEERETVGADGLREEVVAQAPSSEDPLESRGILDEDLDFDLQVGPDGLPLPMTPEQLELRRQAIEKERQEHLAECEQLYAAVRSDTIKNISLDIRLQGEPGEDFPFECTGRHPAFQPRNWAQTTYLWKASGLCHKPLYFEQVQLERYGHDWGPVLQPLVSGAHFFATIPILPYKMGIETPQECIYTLGYYRPGSCAPYMIEAFPFTWRAAAFQAGAVTGVAAAVP
jgi:hypothetical protein